MRDHLILYLLFSSYLLLISCKTSKISTLTPISVNEDITDSLADPLSKPEHFITKEGDTLTSLEEEVEISLQTALPERISLIAVGDMMTGTNFPNESYLPIDDGNLLWKDVAPVLKSADVTFGNLEGVILTQGGEQKECKNPKTCYLFRTPNKLSFHYQEAGFDLLSLANNHANDFGETGRVNTQKVLDSLGINYAGSIEAPISSISKKKLRIGLLAVAPNKGTVNIHQTDYLINLVQRLDSTHNIVIVSFHAGAEGRKNMHVTREREFYYGEDRGNVYEFAHQMIDNGADVLLGHGPHVPRAIEVYKNRFIAYSLGNFLTYGRFNLKGESGEAPVVELNLNPEGVFLDGQIHSFYQDYSLGPRKDESLRAIDTIQELSREDFPENPIEIDDSGRIFYLQN